MTTNHDEELRTVVEWLNSLPQPWHLRGYRWLKGSEWEYFPTDFASDTEDIQSPYLFCNRARIAHGRLECRTAEGNWEPVLAVVDRGTYSEGLNIHHYPHRWRSLRINVIERVLKPTHQMDLGDLRQTKLDLA